MVSSIRSHNGGKQRDDIHTQRSLVVTHRGPWWCWGEQTHSTHLLNDEEIVSVPVYAGHRVAPPPGGLQGCIGGVWRLQVQGGVEALTHHHEHLVADTPEGTDSLLVRGPDQTGTVHLQQPIRGVRPAV